MPDLDDRKACASEERLPLPRCSLHSSYESHHVDVHSGANQRTVSIWYYHFVDEESGITFLHGCCRMFKDFAAMVIGPL